MKKRYFVLFTVFVFLCTAICILLTACNNKDYPVFSNEQLNGNLLADNYKDYANEVYLDYENNPELETQGLFWTKWDDVNKKIVYVKADTAEGAALVDPSKPTIINAHGIKIRESSARDSYEVKLDIAKGSDFGYDTEKVNTLRIWLDQGYNVAVFSWEKFADDGIMQLCEKLYGEKLSNNNSGGMTDEFGRPASVWTYAGEKVTAPKAADATYTAAVSYKTIYSDLGLTTDSQKATVVTNDKDNTADKTITLTKSATTELGANGDLIQVYKTLKSNGTVESVRIVVTMTYAGEVTAVTTNSDDERVVKVDGKEYKTEAFAKDDVVLYTLVDNKIKSMSLANLAVGVGYDRSFARPVLERAWAGVHLLSHKQLSGNLIPLDKGYALHAEGGVRLKGFSLQGGYLYSHRFVTILGSPYFGSLSALEEGGVYPQAHLVYERAEYTHNFGKVCAVGVNVSLFHRLAGTGHAPDGTAFRSSASTSVLAGIYLRTSFSVLLARLNAK